MSNNTTRTWYRPTNTTTYLTFFLSNPSLGRVRLTHAPDGWSDAGYSYSRSGTYSGIFRKYSLSKLGFVKEGKAFLEKAELEQGFEAEIILEVWEYNPTTIINEKVFQGNVQLIDKDVDELKYTVPIDDSSFERKVISRESIPVIVTKKSQDEIYKSLDGKELPGYANEGNDITLPNRIDYLNNSMESDKNQSYESTLDKDPLIPVLTKISGADDNVTSNSNVFKSISGAFYANNTGIDVIVDINGTISLVANISAFIQSTSDVKVFLYVIDTNDNIILTIDITGTVTFLSADFFLNSYSVVSELSELITVQNGNYLQIGVFQDNYTFGASVSRGAVIDFSIRTQGGFAPQKNVKGMLASEMMNRIGQVITSENIPFYSEILGRKDSEPLKYTYNGYLSLLAFTNGALIRGFPMTNGVGYSEPIAPLSISLKDAFEALNTITPIGMGVKLLNGNKVFFIEELQYFFDTRVVMLIDNATELKSEYNKDFIPNQVEFGYSKFESDEKVDGFYDYNTKSGWSNAITSTDKKEIVISKISASNTSINEARRITKKEKPTTDSKYDDINYMIDLVENTTGNAVSNGDAEQGTTDWAISNVVTVENLIGSNRFVLGYSNGQSMISQNITSIKEPILSFSYAVISTVTGLVFTPTFQITATLNDNSKWSLNSLGSWIEGSNAYAAPSVNGIKLNNFQSMFNFSVGANEALENINYITVSFNTAFLANQLGTNQLILDDIYVSDSAKYKARTNEGFDYIRGIVNADDSYNIRLSPARSLVRHGFKLRAPLEYKLNTEYVFSNSDKISTLVSKVTGESKEVSESTNVLVNDLDTPLYGVELITFDALITSIQKNTLNQYHEDGKPKVYSLIGYRENVYQAYKYGWINDLNTGGFQSKATIEIIPVSKYITVAEETYAIDDDLEIFTDDDNEQFTID
jgi:hypothetical protein